MIDCYLHIEQFFFVHKPLVGVIILFIITNIEDRELKFSMRNKGVVDQFVIEGFFLLWISAFGCGKNTSVFVDLNIKWCNNCKRRNMASSGDMLQLVVDGDAC